MRYADLQTRVLHRLGDTSQRIWTQEEAGEYLRLAIREMALSVRAVWDQVYLEDLPAGFSFTYPWESKYAVFNYGMANCTSESDEEFVGRLDEQPVRANHTCPSDLHQFGTVGADSSVSATVRVPDSLVGVERAVWDRRSIEGLSPRHIAASDTRYETTEGEVFGFIWRKDGDRVVRKIRVPARWSEILTVSGSFGIVRVLTDAYSGSVTGTWGIPRRVPGYHPIGNSVGWGLPRRFYQPGFNFRLDHWRQSELTDGLNELPDRYLSYLTDFAQWKCLVRNGPGQDFKLAQLYKDRWTRGLMRMENRINRTNKERLHRLGGQSVNAGTGPPRARLPWQYGSRVR